MTAQRMIALAMWITTAGFIIVSAVQGNGLTGGASTLLGALILLRICDLEDRLKRMDDKARHHAKEKAND